MALAPIICEKGKHRISPATALKEVNGEIWCEDCVAKSIEGTKIESNPCAEAGNYFKSMNLDLEKAKWIQKFIPHSNSQGYSRFACFAADSYIWGSMAANGDKFRMEIFENGNWRLWKWDLDMVAWQPQLEGEALDWPANWLTIDAICSPK